MSLTSEYASPQIYYSLACFMYIIIGVMGAAVRWFHMCRPYDEQGDFFYPARRQVSFFYLAVAMQLPYVFCPMDEDVWFFIRAFGIIYYPTCFAMIYRRYFRSGKMNRNWHSRLFFVVPFFLLFFLLALVLFGEGDVFLRHYGAWMWILAALGVLQSIHFVQEGWWLQRKIDAFHTQNFSNPTDFPYAFASRVVYYPMIWFVAMWVIFLADSRYVKLIVDLLFGFWMIAFLCQILHPNKFLRSLPQEHEKVGGGKR